MNCLIVPSIRESSIHEFLNKWDGLDWTIIVVEDNPEKSFRLLDVEHHYSWAEINHILGDDAWIISRRDSAIRSFGFYIAHQLGAEHIFTLDDDCHPSGTGFIMEHKLAMDAVPTLIFDEVDAGVGGGVAEIVGGRLRELASQRQVLCVTHLPQVASQAHHHLRVAKMTDGHSTRTTVGRLNRAARVEEIARMLGGIEITARTRAHADEMLGGETARKAG